MEPRNYQSGAAGTAPAAEASPSNGFPTDGNPATSTPATLPGAAWFHQIGEELRNLVVQAGITPDDTDLTQVYDAIVAIAGGSDVPVGAVMAFPTGVVPSGWFVCDGAPVSRTAYSALYSGNSGSIGTTYGAGDGSTTYNLPDYEGEFLRGWDNGAGRDPDAASRTDRGDGTTGDSVGTKQDHLYEEHSHQQQQLASTGAGTGGGGNFLGSIPSAFQTGLAGGNETRPRNVNVMYIIKY